MRGAEDTPKPEAGERTIALGPKLAEELWQHRRRTAFSGAGETFRPEAELLEQRLFGSNGLADTGVTPA